ncbi:hypothetical protein M514_11030 [Trichuris suis]|uniref:HTH psq-type domain-containing protein n=1 Tax=Trichuris suis TaxID=68888 RepID=A0A085LSZ1_9BILA|nr:hypothetical protein M513_11030 [Trichuris suis]KFD61457.1 hypothetical protein M514_11030 [Trichuris suis]
MGDAKNVRVCLVSVSVDLIEASTSSKRKRVVLSLEEKKEILQALERGVSGRSISEKYGTGTAKVSDIKRKGRTILIIEKNGHKKADARIARS